MQVRFLPDLFITVTRMQLSWSERPPDIQKAGGLTPPIRIYSWIAQQVEQSAVNRSVAGSNPVPRVFPG